MKWFLSCDCSSKSFRLVIQPRLPFFKQRFKLNIKITMFTNLNQQYQSSLQMHNATLPARRCVSVSTAAQIKVLLFTSTISKGYSAAAKVLSLSDVYYSCNRTN